MSVILKYNNDLEETCQLCGRDAKWECDDLRFCRACGVEMFQQHPVQVKLYIGEGVNCVASVQ